MARKWTDYQAVQRFPLLRDYINVFGNVSYFNEMAGLLSFFYVQGQVVVDFIRIPIGGTHLDPRSHLFWIQPTRSGKTIGWEHTGEAIEQLGVEMVEFTTGTDAGLIGSFDKEVTNEGTITTLVEGVLAGKKCMNFDEGSVLFEKTNKHLQEVIIYMQKAMNAIGTRGNQMEKEMKGVTVRTQSRVSFWLTTFPPDGVQEIVLGKGVFQRVLLLIRPWAIEKREDVSEKRMNTAFNRPPEYEHSMEDFKEYFSTIRSEARQRCFSLSGWNLSEWDAAYNNLEDDPFKTSVEGLLKEVMYDWWTVTPDFHPLLNSHKDHLFELVRLMEPKLSNVCAAFIPNLLNYTIIFATHMAILDQYTQHGKIKEWKITGEHVEMAAEIIYDLYEELVTWLEEEVELEHVAKARKVRKVAWQTAFQTCKLVSVEGKEGSWIRKSELLQSYAKQNGNLSRNTQFLHYKEAKELFNEVSVGVSKFVRWTDDD